MQSSTLSSPRDGVARRSVEQSPPDSQVWQTILKTVRTLHPTLHRVWFDQLTAHELSNGMIQVKTQSLPQLNFLQMQGQQTQVLLLRRRSSPQPP